MDKESGCRQKLQESTIEERDFESSFDDSFVLRTKPSSGEGATESGFESACHTISFNEDDKVERTGIMMLIDREKERNFGDKQDGRKEFYSFRILEKKV